MVRVIAAFILSTTAFLTAAEPIDFARDIRPILADRCYKCHGFDDNAREADLGLHNFSSATQDLGGYQAITPGDPEKSEIITRMLSDDEDEVMPPPNANKPKLTPAEISTFKQWIKEGAKYEAHWSFVHPRKSNVIPPRSKLENPIDAFVEKRLKAKKLSFSPAANSNTMVRRLYLDLIGLPPTPEQVETFAQLATEKNLPSAVSQTADELLASPQYGEKWSRDWLDLARYADTNGYEKDRPRSIWPYRDWVINALNADMPYDQFTIEQLAGDMLPNATIDQKIATGFHRNTMLNEEGGIDPLEFRFNAIADRVATTGTVWMGLTTGCAQCHTHKFDPITHTDYYALFALLNNAEEPEIEIPDPEIIAQREKIQEQIRSLEIAETQKIDKAKFTKWIAQNTRPLGNWTDIKPRKSTAEGILLEVENENVIYASGDFTKRHVYDLEFDISGIKPPITGIRLEALPDERLPANGPGTAYYEGRKGDFFLSEFTATVDDQKIGFKNASISFGKIAIGSGKVTPEGVFDGNGSSGWSTATGEGKRHELILEFEQPIQGKSLDVSMLFERHFVAALGKFRIAVTTDAKPVPADASTTPNPAVSSDIDMETAYVNHAKEFAAFQKKVTSLEKSIPALPTTLVMRERTSKNPRETTRHHRGEYLSAKESVGPAVPAIFESIDGDPNRLNLAKWLVSEKNPLAARVAVNRAWRAFFGRGILYTAGDFGLQSETPSHPELLNWLAVKFIDDGWSLKKLHRQIVTSQTYQQQSELNSELMVADPQNVLLSRGPRFRMSGEVLRDAALASSGLLSKKIGGKSVFPPQPSTVAAAAYGGTKWNVSKGEDRYRRSLYTFSKRTAPFAAYLTFDGPTGESCLARREISNTPLQSLTLLNDTMFLEAARALAESTLLNHQSNPVASKIFQRVLSREPTESELIDLTNFYEAQLARLKKNELDAQKISGKPDPELAAWTLTARVILNLDEAVTKQ